MRRCRIHGNNIVSLLHGIAFNFLLTQHFKAPKYSNITSFLKIVSIRVVTCLAIVPFFNCEMKHQSKSGHVQHYMHCMIQIKVKGHQYVFDKSITMVGKYSSFD